MGCFVIADNRMRCFDKSPGKVFISIFPVVDAFLFIVAKFLACYTAGIGSIVAYLLKHLVNAFEIIFDRCRR